MERYIIALQQLGIKNDILLRLITQYSFSDIELIFKDVKNSIFFTDIEFVSQSSICNDSRNIQTALNYADKIMEKNYELGIKTAVYGRENYPVNLQKIKNSPVLIYYYGSDIKVESEKAIACVGTRNPTKLTYNVMNYLIPQLVEEGYTIISGLALGSDRLAHISCMESGGNTIAVLAHGLDQIFPKKNVRLAEDIIKNGGTLVSEYAVGIQPEKFRYINRNRLIVGLSRGILIGECAMKSGTMHSVSFSREQKKPIFCTSTITDGGTNQIAAQELIRGQIATDIPNGRAYDSIVGKTGYKLSKDRLSVNEIEHLYLKSLIYNLWDNKKILDDFIVSLSNKNIKIEGLRKDKYLEILYKNKMPIEELKEKLINLCIENVSE